VAGGFLRTEMIDRDSIVPHRDVEASSQRPRLIILSTGGTIAFYLPSGMALTETQIRTVADAVRDVLH
jgi:L-asparaginase/Glu-tRNA(Gln) amidotransferase subunit D